MGTMAAAQRQAIGQPSNCRHPRSGDAGVAVAELLFSMGGRRQNPALQMGIALGAGWVH